MGCGEFLVKYILFFANLVFALAGLAMLGLGIAAQLQISVITNLTEGSYQLAAISSMVIGGTIFLISFFGCCGAVRESNCMLVTYSIMMLILMVVKLTFAIMIFVNLQAIVDEVPKWLDVAFKQDLTAYHELESAFKCCGTSSAMSYLSPTLPPSCCVVTASTCTPLNAYSGCNTVVGEFFHTFGLAIGVVAIVVVSIELVGVVFGLCLANHVRNKNRRSRY